MTTMSDSLALIATLQQPGAWPDRVEAVQLIETHISWVLLTGAEAFKIRKPVDLGFLDYSTLARRDHCAHEEVRLNRRFAPEIYRDVVRITGTAAAPRFDGEGPLLEVAVRMKQFDHSRQLDLELAAGRLSTADLRAVADAIVAFQDSAPRAEVADPYGSPEAVLAPVRENFSQLRGICADMAAPAAAAEMLDQLEAVSLSWAEGLHETFLERRAGGFIREGHGDLHLANLTRLPEGIRAFDGIEFSAELRWIDVVNDLAFLFMDLSMRGRQELAWVMLNQWLLRSGDHRGLALLRFYVLYRAMVRAKVAALRAGQLPGEEREAALSTMVDYLKFGRATVAAAVPKLILACGVSGSGKSWLGERLAAAGGWVHLRSDVERKRLFGLAAEARSGSDKDGGIYTAGASRLTYAHLLQMATELLAAQHSVLVDATFLQREHRQPFLELARRRGIEATVIFVDGDPELFAERVRRRLRAGEDASEADERVLRDQLRELQRPQADEGCRVLRVDGGDSVDLQGLLGQV